MLKTRLHSTRAKRKRCYDVMLSRQEVNTMRHLANAQYWDRPAGGNTGRLFLAFGGPVCADRFSNNQKVLKIDYLNGELTAPV